MASLLCNGIMPPEPSLNLIRRYKRDFPYAYTTLMANLHIQYSTRFTFFSFVKTFF